jgi:hypothetical protein
MPSRRHYVNNAPQQTLTSQINNVATSLAVASFTGWPSQFPFFATLELGTANEEIVSVTNIVGGTATIVRGQDGSTAISHLAGATFDFTVVSLDLDEANAHTSANSGVHGISGNVVGTSDVQTLTNKSLTSPTVTGTLTAASETLSGTLSVTGTSTVGVVNASGAVTASAAGTGLAVTNNVTVGGTEAVTGASTAASYAANGNGTVTGVIVAKSYSNQAAAPASPATGTQVLLTAPTGGFRAGLFWYDGTQYVPTSAPQELAYTATASDLSSTGATEVMGYSQSVSLISGKKYRVTVKGIVSPGAANGQAVIRVRYDTAAVSNTSTKAGQDTVVLLGALSAAGRTGMFGTFEFNSPTTATYNVAVGVATFSGAGNSSLLGSVVPTEATIEYLG